MKLLNKKQITSVAGGMLCEGIPSGTTMLTANEGNCIYQFCIRQKEIGYFKSEDGPTRKKLVRNKGEYRKCDLNGLDLLALATGVAVTLHS